MKRKTHEGHIQNYMAMRQTVEQAIKSYIQNEFDGGYITESWNSGEIDSLVAKIASTIAKHVQRDEQK